MCGIFAIQTDTNAAGKTLDALKTLEYRGYDSWGVAWKDSLQATDHRLHVEKKVGKIGAAVLPYSLLPVASSLAIGHTRWATHGGVTDANAHPHQDCTGRFALVHNGIVENFLELKTALLATGHVFKSETDSEVIVHRIEVVSKETGASTRDVVRQVFGELTGLNAIVLLDGATNTIVACKKGSPLVVGKENVLASDAIALLPYTDQVHYMEDGEMVVLNRSGLKIFDIESGREKAFAWKPIEKGNAETGLDRYPHFMLKEIHQQTKILSKLSTTCPYVSANWWRSGINFQLSTQAKRIFFVACGSAYYAGLYGQYLCLEKGIDARAIVGSEFGRYIPQLTHSDTVIFLSQSGETIDLVEHAKAVQKKDIHILGIINREGSTLERLCTEVIHLGAGPEQCVLATKSWTAKIAVLTALFGKQAERVIHIDPFLIDSYRKEVVRPIAERLAQATDIYVLGRGIQYPLALETALKIKEVTYIHAEAQPGGELKHGSIALISPATPVIVFALHDETYEEIISNAMEVKARGAYVIGISDSSHPCFDVSIAVGEKSGNPNIAAIITMQLVAYEMALLLGRDPDKPRNLAKSVTVK